MFSAIFHLIFFFDNPSSFPISLFQWNKLFALTFYTNRYGWCTGKGKIEWWSIFITRHYVYSVENKLIYLKWIYGRYCLASQILWHLVTSSLSLSLTHTHTHTCFLCPSLLLFASPYRSPIFLSFSHTHKVQPGMTHTKKKRKKTRRGETSCNSALYRLLSFSASFTHCLKLSFYSLYYIHAYQAKFLLL